MSNHATITIAPEELHKYINMSLEEYKGQVDDVIKKSTKELSKKVKPELKSYSKRIGKRQAKKEKRLLCWSLV